MPDHVIAGTPADSPRAWLVVAAAFIAGFVVFGILYSISAFLVPMSAELGAGRTETSALFSISGLVFYFSGPLTGYLGDRLGARRMVAAGGLALGAGIGLTACINQMWVGYLTYGLGVGIGCACAYTPSLAIVGGWFLRRRGAALGVAAAGTGCGTLVLPPLAAALIVAHGWRIAFILLAVLCGLLLLLAAALIRPPPFIPPGVPGQFSQAIRSRSFLMLYASWICATTALFVPFMLLPAYAQQYEVGPVAASALLSVIGGISIGGRLAMGGLVQWIGTLRLFKAAVFIMAGSYLLWFHATGYPGMVAFAAVLGLGYGLRIALMPAVLIELYGLGNLGALLGTFFTASGIAALVGPLAAAAIADVTGGYSFSIGFALLLGTLGFIMLLPMSTTRPAPP